MSNLNTLRPGQNGRHVANIIFEYISQSDIVFWFKVSTQASGGRLNKKDGLTRYGDSHVKDKTS